MQGFNELTQWSLKAAFLDTVFLSPVTVGENN